MGKRVIFAVFVKSGEQLKMILTLMSRLSALMELS